MDRHIRTQAVRHAERLHRMNPNQRAAKIARAKVAKPARDKSLPIWARAILYAAGEG